MIPICQVMNTAVEALLATQSVSDAALFFQSSGLTSLPVVDQDRKLVGIVLKESLKEKPSGTPLGKS